jgi:hypothetical protein
MTPLYSAICKLAIAGERAGFTVEQMIGLLNAGLTVESLVDMIEERLSPHNYSATVPQMSSSRWIM